MNSDIYSKYFYYHKKHILKMKVEMKKFTNILWVQGAALQIMVSGICPILKRFFDEIETFGSVFRFYKNAKSRFSSNLHIYQTRKHVLKFFFVFERKLRLKVDEFGDDEN